jgi:mannosidase alpha-like ER degradation enhancer 2
MTMRTLVVSLAVVFLFLQLSLAQNDSSQTTSTQAAVSPPTPSAPVFHMTDAEKAAMAERVRDEALYAWNGYKKYAWGHDALKPLSHKPFDWYGHSLLMTPVDALDTLVLMGLKPQADEARSLIDTELNLDQDIYVKDFEITIRLLGSLISCYELTGDKRLLELADDLGRRMLPMFNSPTGMPYEYVNLHTGAVRGARSNPAEIGTLLIEYGMLSRHTGKQEYYDKAKRAAIELYKRRSPIGLVGAEIDVETGAWMDERSGIMGGIDSYYEYLLKASILFGDKDCARMWKESVAAINKHLADSRPNGLWIGQADMNHGERRGTFYGALDAFFPALLALGGDVKRSAELQDSSYLMWNVAGLEPELLDYSNMQVVDPHYELRPEIIESTYYLYHYTHDPKYLAMGQTFFNGLVKYCRTDDGYAAVIDVRTMQKRDSMESFFFAETLKYLYLLYAPESTLDFDSVIFNTEAHPMKRSVGLK